MGKKIAIGLLCLVLLPMLLFAVDAEGEVLVLTNNDTLTMTGQALTVDLAGYDLTVTGTGIISLLDSANDTYDETACGTLTVDSDEITVLPSATAEDKLYIALQENGKVTAHRLDMALTHVTLRTHKAGIKYKAKYTCDDTLAQKVQAYGVVLSLFNMPGADFKTEGKDSNIATVMSTPFKSGVVAESGSVFNIMRSDLSTAENNGRSKRLIYANAYIDVGTGPIMADTKNVGKTSTSAGFDGVAHSLRSVMMLLDDGYYGLTSYNRSLVDNFYDQWKAKGMNWDFKSIGQLAPAAQTNVADPLTWEKINALPVANDQMSEDELRQLCLDFMEMTLLCPWTPSEELDFIPKDTVTKTFEFGAVYGGTPYISNTMGNIYTMMEYYDERNGMLDVSGGMDTLRLFSNQCSGSAFWAWSRVSAEIAYIGTENAVKSKGCLPVGDYTYDESIEHMIKDGIYTTDICLENGSQTMFESYAQMKPADGIVFRNLSSGHIRMISGINVVRDANGEIDGDKSTVSYIDQDGKWYSHTQSNGTPYDHVGGYNMKVSFLTLFTDGYIPFTFEEFIDAGNVEKSKTIINHTAETMTISQLKNAKITGNYSISDVTIVIKDENGKQVLRNMVPAYLTGVPVPTAKVALAYTSDMDYYADGKYTIEISARIGTGEKPVVYTGTLVS